MKKRLTRFLSGVFVVVLLFLFSNCEVGLGDAVDTEVPAVTVTAPSDQASVSDWFYLAGSCSDDQGIKEISISYTGTTTAGDTVSEKLHGAIVTGKDWYVKLNERNDTDDDGIPDTYPLADGTYTFSATARDSAGHATVASRTLNIDNTAPVLILTTPASYGTDLTPKVFGRSVKLAGDFAEQTGSKISKMVVHVYKKTDLSFVTSLVFDDVTMTAGTPFVVAKYADPKPSGGESLSLYDNYVALYGSNSTSAAGQDNFYFTLTLSDAAEKFQDTAHHSAVTDTDGNTTDSFILSTPDVSEYLTSENSGSLQLSVQSIKNILNGTQQDPSTGSVQVKKILHDAFSAAVVTTGTLSNTASLAVNPKNNPTFTVTNFALESGSAIDENHDGSGFFYYLDGNPINITINAGLDNANVKFSDTENPVTVYVQRLADDDTTGTDFFSGSEKQAVYTFPATTADSTSETQSFTLSGYTAGRKYLITVDGEDVNGQSIESYNGVTYAFITKASTERPEIEIDSASGNLNLEDGTIVSGADFTAAAPDCFGYTGKITIYAESLTSFSAEVTAADRSGTTVTNIPTLSVTTTKNSTESTSGVSVYDFTTYMPSDYSWPENNPGNYKYTFTFSAVDNAGSVSVKSGNSRYLYIDTNPPVMTFTDGSKLAANEVVTENNSYLKSSSASVTGFVYSFQGSWSDSSGSGTKTLEYSIDDGTTWIDASADVPSDGINPAGKIKAGYVVSQSIATGTADNPWTVEIAVAEGGAQQFRFRGTDSCGNTKTLGNISGLMFDTGVPVIDITNGALYVDNNTAYSVKGSVSDTNAVLADDVVITLRKNGATYTGSGISVVKTQVDACHVSFMVTGISDKTIDGCWVASVKATDAAGREASASSSVTTIDTAVPVIGGTHDNTLSYVDSGSPYTINGTYTDANIDAVYYRVITDDTAGDGVEPPAISADEMTGWNMATIVSETSISGIWNAAITWDAGTQYGRNNHVYVAAADKAGNMGSVIEWSVKNPDSSWPVIDINDSCSYTTNPSTTIYTKNGVTVSGTITESNLTAFYVSATLDGNSVTGQDHITDSSDTAYLVTYTAADYKSVTAANWSFTVPVSSTNDG
ncbi:MAG: hypothetical protein LKF96_09995, partial [Treponema sp.]|nr:hypothetical protein [Treponema sp.]